jgi:hypothetical protein
MNNFDYELRLLIIYPKKGNKIHEMSNILLKQFFYSSAKVFCR